MLISFNLKGTETDVVSPLRTKLLSKPRKTRGGSPAFDGNPRYTWLTSFPSTLPVFFTAYVTVHAVWNKFAGPPGEVWAGDEIAGGAEEVAVALPETVDVLLPVIEVFAVAAAVTVAFLAAEKAVNVDEGPGIWCLDCNVAEAEALDAAADGTARLCEPGRMFKLLYAKFV